MKFVSSQDLIFEIAQIVYRYGKLFQEKGLFSRVSLDMVGVVLCHLSLNVLLSGLRDQTIVV